MRRTAVRGRPPLGLALRRRPRLRGGLAVAAAVLSGGVVAATVQAADEARRAWGATVTVVVATRDLEPGATLDEGNTRLVAHPSSLVPDDALRALGDGERVRSPVLAGEVVREPRLAPGGLSAVAARLPEGTRAMAVPVEPGTTPPLERGDRVDVLVALAPDAAGGGPPGFALATEVTVVEVTDTAVTLAVPRDVAPRLAVAYGQGAVTLALVGG